MLQETVGSLFEVKKMTISTCLSTMRAPALKTVNSLHFVIPRNIAGLVAMYCTSTFVFPLQCFKALAKRAGSRTNYKGVCVCHGFSESAVIDRVVINTKPRRLTSSLYPTPFSAISTLLRPLVVIQHRVTSLPSETPFPTDSSFLIDFLILPRSMVSSFSALLISYPQQSSLGTLLYPPTTPAALRRLLHSIHTSSVDRLKQDCFVYYLLRDRDAAVPSTNGHHGAMDMDSDGKETKPSRRAEIFARQRVLPGAWRTFMDGYWALDHGLWDVGSLLWTKLIGPSPLCPHLQTRQYPTSISFRRSCSSS